MTNTTKVYLSKVSSLENKGLFDSIYSQMPAYRKEKIDRLVFDKDKMLSLGVGALLRHACKDFNIVGEDEHIIYNSQGKPYFENSNISFNLSHSKDMVMCVMSKYEVGCDIEKTQDLSDKVCQKVFTDNEILTLSNNSSLKIQAWTMKESYMKYLGKGFSLPPSSFEIDFDKNTIKGEKDILIVSNSIDDYYYSICTKDKNIQIQIINLEQLR